MHTSSASIAELTASVHFDRASTELSLCSESATVRASRVVTRLTACLSDSVDAPTSWLLLLRNSDNAARNSPGKQEIAASGLVTKENRSESSFHPRLRPSVLLVLTKATKDSSDMASQGCNWPCALMQVSVSMTELSTADWKVSSAASDSCGSRLTIRARELSICRSSGCGTGILARNTSATTPRASFFRESACASALTALRNRSAMSSIAKYTGKEAPAL